MYDVNGDAIIIGDRVSFDHPDGNKFGTITGYDKETDIFRVLPDDIKLQNESHRDDKTWGRFGRGIRKQFTTVGVSKGEKPCRNCSRKNDIGINKCWCCEASNP